MEWLLISMGLVALLFAIIRRSWALALFLVSLVPLAALIASVILSQMLAELGSFVLTGICWGILGIITDQDGNRKIRGKKTPVLSITPRRVSRREWCSA